MASVNKEELDVLTDLYVTKKLSIPMCAKELGVPLSTIRARLFSLGILRDRADAIRLARDQGRIGVHLKGKKRVFTETWKTNLAASLRLSGAARAKGFSLKPSGYLAFTRGEHKERSLHVVIMEQALGRHLHAQEVVHHIDHNKQNNALENLQIMTRSEHASHHAKIAYKTRKRNEHGQFK